MKEFDWKQAYNQHNAATVKWLQSIHNKVISEEEFIKQWLELPHHGLRTTTRRPAKMYQYLKKTFGFFK